MCGKVITMHENLKTLMDRVMAFEAVMERTFTVTCYVEQTYEFQEFTQMLERARNGDDD